jgi:hypothetical protein
MPTWAARKSAPSHQERTKLVRGENIKLNPRLDKVHLFDAESGKVIA